MDGREKLKGDWWRAHASNSTGYRGRNLRWELCAEHFSNYFNVGKATDCVLQVSTDKPHGLHWYKIVTGCGPYWYWGDIPNDASSPWCSETDEWLARYFGSKPVYLTCWVID